MIGKKEEVKKLRQQSFRLMRRVIGSWKYYDKTYGWKWRTANSAAALLILVSILLPVYNDLYQGKAYSLSVATKALVGSNNASLASKLKYNSTEARFEFNKEAVKEFDPTAALTQQVGGSDAKSTQQYALDVHKDIRKGVTIHDINTQLSFDMVPQFVGMEGRAEDGHLVFPLGKDTQAVYTLKNNGLKEDIVVQKTTKDTMRFTYKLMLPKSLEARALPDKSGDIGIYGADPALYGDISYGSDNDRAAVEKAREKAQKTELVFGIPAPVITASKDDQGAGKATARFELRGDELTVVAEGLKNLEKPFSIDPSIVVPTSSNFETDSNNESNIEFGASSINRSALSGGTISSWGTSTAIAGGGCGKLISGVNNSFVYCVDSTTVRYAALNGFGAISGSWQTSATTLPATPTTGRAGFVYNGYLYVTGGDNSNTPVNTVVYIKLSSSGGTTGSWQTATTLSVARFAHVAFAYNGYAYAISGRTGAATYTNTVDYAAIKADGSLGTWSTTTNVPGTGRYDHAATVYNGYLYLMGGQDSGGTLSANVYTSINSNGALGSSWTTTSGPVTSNNSSRKSTAIAVKGYMYLMGGWTGAACITEVRYAPIQANGSLGEWNTTTTTGMAATNCYPLLALHRDRILVLGGENTAGSNLTSYRQGSLSTMGVNTTFATDSDEIVANPPNNGRIGAGTAAYNGYLYVVGGGDFGNGQQNTVLYAALNADGSTGSWTSTSAFATVRTSMAVVAYDGYMYISGGYHNAADTACHTVASITCSDVQKAQINNDGTLGAWSAAGTGASSNYLPGARYLHAGFARNGYLYAVGGLDDTDNPVSTVYYSQIGANGVIGAWSTSATAISAGGQVSRARSGAAIYGNYIYLVGGQTTGSTYTDTIIIGTFGTNGDIASWAQSGTTINAPRRGLRAAVSDGVLYISGGSISGGSVVTTTQYTRLDNNGDLGAWQTATNTYSTARAYHGMEAYNGYIYVIAGCSNPQLVGEFNNCSNAASMRRDVQYTRVNNGGGGALTNASGSSALNSWANKGSFTTARTQHAAVAYNGYLYISGGCSTATGLVGCTTSTNSTMVAPIATNGSLVWSNLLFGPGVPNDPPTNRYGHAMVAHNGYLYVIGGCSSTGGTNGFCTTYLNDVQRVKLNSDGNTAGNSWASAGSTLGTARYGHSATAYNDYIYVMGGCSATTSGNCSTFERTVEYAQINGSALGSWASTGGSGFTTGRFLQTGLAYNGKLYVSTGCSAMSSGNCTGLLNDVQYATINSNGTVGTTWSSTVQVPTARFGASLTVRNGMFYLTGGCSANSSGSCTAYRGDIQTAPIISNGLISSWWGQQGEYTDPRYLQATVVSNGYFYILGGVKTGATLLADSPGSTISLIARIARYSKLIDFGRQVNALQIGSTSAIPDAGLNIRYKAAGQDAIFDVSGTKSELAPTGTCTGNAQETRYLLITVILDDMWGNASYNELNGSTLTDLTVNYYISHVAPSIRLRHGQSLQTGELTPLDTCESIGA